VTATVGIAIRAVRTADHDGVVDLWDRCGLSRPWIDARTELELKVATDPEGLLVAETPRGELAGTVMAGFDGHRGWVNYLAVEPGLRRQGIAAALMGAAEARLASLGAPKVNLQVRTTNDDVLGFYAALGYVDDDVVSLGKRLS
jgi:ribosomal protein S18 acetylase RimI-like enzyme